MAITAAKAGDALSTISIKLLEGGILQQEGFAVLQRVASDIKKGKDSTSWQIEVDRGAPIIFAKVKDKGGLTITPAIVAKAINVEQNEKVIPPFAKLDMALEIDDDQSNPISRWHLDLANETGGVIQAGPLVHLQYGGHHHNAGHLDHPLKTPRWCHPPMELALLCEVVAANFYEEEWVKLRDDPNWCKSICVYQTLCYANYIAKMHNSLSISSSTALNSMWASAWLN